MNVSKSNDESRKARREEKRRAFSFVGNKQQATTSHFGSAIRAKRKQLGITQTELAERAGLNRSYLSELERGKTSISLERAEKIAKALSCELTGLWQ